MSRAKRIDRYQIGYAKIRRALEFVDEGIAHPKDKIIRDLEAVQEILQDATDREYRKAGNKYYPR